MGSWLREFGLVPCGAAESPAGGTGHAQSRAAVSDGPDQPDLQLLAASRHNGFQCSRLGHLHVRGPASANLLPSTLTSLTMDSIGKSAVMGDVQDQHLRSQPSLVHICFTSQLVNLSQVKRLVSGVHHVLHSVPSLELTIQPQAFILPDMDGIMTGQYFSRLGAWFPSLQRLHIHLQGRQQAKEVLIAAAWLPAHCRLVVTHELTCPVHIVKCPSGCLSLHLSSHPADA